MPTQVKYKLGEREDNGLCRVIALAAFSDVAAGDVGGYVEAEQNLAHTGDAWVYGDALVYGNALVSGNARVSGNAQVYRDALVYGNARVSGNAQVRFGATSLAPVAVSGGRYACTMLPGVGASIGCQDFLPEHLTSTEVFRAECDKRGYLVTAEESALIRALWCVAEVTYANS